MVPGVLGVLLLASAIASGGPLEERLRFDRLTVREGLSHNTVRAILQDHDGFLWVGTQDGLNRWDGYVFRKFRHDPRDPNSPSHNFVMSMAEDEAHAIWSGTLNGGVNRFDPHTERWTQYRRDAADPSSLPSDAVGCLTPSRVLPGSVWVGTQDAGLARLFAATGRAERIRLPGPQDARTRWIASLLEDGTGTLWIGTQGGLFRRDSATGETTRVAGSEAEPAVPAADHILALHEDAAGAVWALNARSLDRIEPSGRVTRFVYRREGAGTYGYDMLGAIAPGASGTLWFSSFDGLRELEPSSGAITRIRARPFDADGLATERLYTLKTDRSGILWIGTHTKGLYRLAPGRNRFPLYRSEPDGSGPLANDRIKGLHFDRAGVLWIGVLDAGLVAFDRAAGTTRAFRHDPRDPSSLPSDNVFSFGETRDGTFLVGTIGGGLARLDRRTGRFTTFRHREGDAESLADDRVWAIFEDRQGRLWIGTDQGLDRMDPKTGTFTHLAPRPGDPSSFPGRKVRFVTETGDGTLWVSTWEGGLARLEPDGRFTSFRHRPGDPTSLSWSFANAVTEARATPGVLWVPTGGGGLNRLDLETGRFRAYREHDGLPNDVVYAALEDAAGFLWLSTDTGLSRFDPRTGRFRNYDTRDGVQGNEFNSKAHARSATGELAFGGMDGLNVFRPEAIQDDPFVPPVVLTDLKVGGRSVAVGEEVSGRKLLTRALHATREIEISWRDGAVTFEFAALAFGVPERNRYAYRLEGVDAGWNETDATRRAATYTSLRGGRYVFHVKASNGDGVWNEAGVSIAVRVVPPLWQVPWVQALGALVLAAAAVAAHRLRLRTVERRRFALERRVGERTREIQEASERLTDAYGEIEAQRDSLKASEAREVAARQAAEAANRAKSDFLSSMSHELRTPLNAIIGFSQVLLERFFGDLNAKQEEYVGDVLASGQHLLSLINDVLDLSKIEAGRMELSRSRFRLKELLERSLVMIRERCARHGIGVSLEVPAALEALEVVADERKVKQVLFNLLSNAAKFTLDGGHIAVEARLAEEGAPPRRVVEVSVADTGIGVPAEEQERIFEVFYQVRGGLTGKTQGTGLGLPIVRRIVEMHGGLIRVESDGEGKGSRFTFSLPLEGAE